MGICLLGSSCARNPTCCAFCDEEDCDIRCMDDYQTCKYFEEPLISEKKEPPPKPEERVTKSGYVVPLAMTEMKEKRARERIELPKRAAGKRVKGKVK